MSEEQKPNPSPASPTDGKSLDPVRLIDLYRLDPQNELSENISPDEIEQQLESPESRRGDINQTRLIDIYQLSPNDVLQPVDANISAADIIESQIGVPEPAQSQEVQHPAVRGGDLYRVAPAKDPDQTVGAGDLEKLVLSDQDAPSKEASGVRGGDLYRIKPAEDPNRTIRVDDLERLISGEPVTVELNDLPQAAEAEKTGIFENLGASHAPMVEGIPDDDFITETEGPVSLASSLEEYRRPDRPILQIGDEQVRKTPIAAGDQLQALLKPPEVLETISSDEIDFIHGSGKTPTLSREMSGQSSVAGKTGNASGKKSGSRKQTPKKSKKKTPSKRGAGKKAKRSSSKKKKPPRKSK